MCAQAYQDIRSPALRLGISVALVPSYLPMLGDVLEQFRQQYPGIPLETASFSNDAVCAQLAERHAGRRAGDGPGRLRGRACPHRAHPAHRSPAGAPLQPVLGAQQHRPGRAGRPAAVGAGPLRPEPLAPLWNTLRQAGARPKVEIGEQYYQVLYRTQERNGLALDRLEITSDHSMDNVQDVGTGRHAAHLRRLLQPEHAEHPCVRLLCGFLQEHLRNL